MTFMNKLDRDGREPLDLVAELEEVLGIEGVAMNWPIGMGQSLLGLYAAIATRCRYSTTRKKGRTALSL